MSPETIFFGFLLAMALLLLQEACKGKKPQYNHASVPRRRLPSSTYTPPSRTLTYTPRYITPDPYSAYSIDAWRRRYPPRSPPWITDDYGYRIPPNDRITRLLGTAPNVLNSNREPRILIDQWRRSILGLIKLAHQNLNMAKTLLKTKNYEGALKAASTSVENIARALIHCYGDKPNPTSGQEEPLKMITNRLAEDERVEFTEAINSLASLPHNHAVLKHLSIHNGMNNPRYYNAKQAEGVVQASQKIIKLFSRIMSRHFATEIPEIQSLSCRLANT